MKIFDVLILTESGASDSPFPRKHQRRGLAPVEMAIMVPFLMLFMAVIIAFGYAASWKVRSEVVSRDVAWRTRIPRNAHRNVRAVEWPEPGRIDRHGDSGISSFENDDILHDPVIAGPIPEVNVNSNVLDFSRGVVEGTAAIKKSPPILARLGRIDYRTEHSFLEDRFQYAQMGISNTTRRLPLIYEIDLDFVRQSADIQYAVAAIDGAPFRYQLTPLDEDEEFIAWRGHAPDFHPRVNTRDYRLDDRAWVQEHRVDGLLNSIDGLPERMVRATISLYRQQLDSIPPLSMGVQGQLRDKIAQLEQYLERLRDR